MRISESQRVRFMERIGRQWQGYDYGYERTWEEALKTYKLALLCAQIKEESSRVIASILHHIAWMYRYQGDAEKEKRFLQHALDAYITVYESGEEELNAARLMYIIGELNRRLKNYNEAIRWFSRVINDKRIMDANMIRACREQWAVVKEEMEEEKRAKQSASSRL